MPTLIIQTQIGSIGLWAISPPPPDLDVTLLSPYNFAICYCIYCIQSLLNMQLWDCPIIHSDLHIRTILGFGWVGGLTDVACFHACSDLGMGGLA